MIVIALDLDVVVVIEEQNRLRTSRARPLERVDNPVVAASAGATNQIQVRRRRVRRRLVDASMSLTLGKRLQTPCIHVCTADTALAADRLATHPGC